MDTDELRFAAADVALLRMAVLPRALAAATRIDLDPEAKGYPDRLTAFLHAVTGDPSLREAVEVSSASLAGTLDRVVAGVPVEPARLQRAAFAVARYLLRMTGRPTPFGLLAGVAVAGFDATGFDGGTKIRLGSDHRKGVRADAVWLSALTDRWELAPAARRHLRVVANDLCFVRGDRLVLPYVRNRHARNPEEKPARGTHEISVRRTAPVRLALELAGRPVPFAELLARLRDRFPGVAEERVETMLGGLVEQDILLTDLRPPPDADDPLGHVLERLAAVDPAALSGLADTRAVAEELRRYRARPLGGGRAEWRSAVEAMRGLEPTQKPPIQVDLRVDVEACLPRAVAEEVERAAAVLWRLSPAGAGPPHLRAYHEEFLERYGSERLVGVTELLDAERGLGPPAGYLVPPGRRRREAAWDEAAGRTRDDALLAALAQDALAAGGEVVLDDKVIDALSPDPADAPPPETMELCVQLFAESADALDAGRFRLALSPLGGSRTAGAIFGRFAYLFEDGARFAGLAVNGTAPAAPGETVPAGPAGTGPLRAQLTFQSLHARGTNVIRVPTVTHHSLPVGMFAERADPSVLDIRDLAVGADADRLYLISLPEGREVRPISPHMLNAEFLAPNAVRLIREIAAGGVRGWTSWGWGRAAVLPVLPRVRYARTVLAPGIWRPEPTLRDRDLSWRQWSRVLDEWRERRRVPDRVQVTEADHRIDLDLSVPFHRQLLRHELTRRRGATVQETADLETADTGGTGLGWLNGHANEIVVPLTVYGGAPRRPAPTGRIRVEAHGHPPGGAWVYAKLYCEDHRHRDVLVDHLPALLGELAPHADRWFFIRYRDPDPHLRLRFHGSPERLNGLLLPRLHDWAAAVCDAGFARRLVLDTYEPEVARYGGDAAIRHAEEVFAADSDAVLAQLAAGADLPPELLAAAGYVHIAQSFLGPEWTRWVGQWFTDTEHHRVFQEHRRQATLVVGCDGDWSALWALAGGSRADETWRRRAAAVATYAATVGELAAAGRLTTTPDAILTGLFHMHHNRLIGADRTSEDRTHAIVRGVVHAHLGRRRAGR